MSRIGKMPVELPSGVNVSVVDDVVTVEGSKGKLTTPLLPGLAVNIEGTTLQVSIKDKNNTEEAEYRARHGLMRTLIANMVTGVAQGFEKKLELNGVGYRVSLAGTDLKFSIGFSHEVVYNLPQGITAAIEQNIITISGIDKQQVGQVAAEIRALKKPEPYKGKGIKYVDERILRKSGKSGKEGSA